MGGSAGADAPSSRRERQKTLAVSLFYLLVLAADLWFFLLLPSGPWEKRVGFLLQVLGIYAIGLGLLERIGVLAAFKSSEEELTSTNLRDFLAANLMLSGTIFLLAAYLLAVVPIAYIAYLPVSIALVGLSHSAPERLLLARGRESYDFDKEVVKHLPALKSFLVGIPAFVVSFATAAWPLYF